ncbi:ABC transporter substrate-binding protein [Paenibacillus chartarius]|uniref:ABC transporter substrate-binding protein n=1 Tax=Paenibacillus chartarius TaxID=747481 RepID=A0ABV6DRX9_9BACL
MKKKMWSSVAASGLVLSVLAGCGTAETGTSNQPAAGGSGQAAGSAPVEIKLHTYGTEATYNWKKTIDGFQQKFPNIKVSVVELSAKGDTQEAGKKLDLAVASGEALDVIMFSDPAGYAQRVGLGMAEPLDAFIAKDGGYKVEEEYKVDTRLNGKVYALPGKFNPWYVLLNKDMLDQAGLQVPKDWTWDQFADYAKKLTKGEGANKVYGTYFHGPQNGGWMEYMKLAMVNQLDNSEFLKADGTSNMEDPNFKKTLELRWKMEKEDKTAFPYESVISQKPAYRNMLFNQKTAMLMIGSWMNTEIGGTDQTPLNFNIAVAPIPKNNASDNGGYTPVTTDFVAVAASSKHKEEAYKFVRWYTTEGQMVQGKNVPSWSKVSNDDLGKIIDTILSGTKSPDKVDKASLISTLAASKASKLIPPVAYQNEVYKAVNEEFEKFIFAKQDLNATVKGTHERVQQIIASNKK